MGSLHYPACLVRCLFSGCTSLVSDLVSTVVPCPFSSQLHPSLSLFDFPCKAARCIRSTDTTCEMEEPYYSFEIFRTLIKNRGLKLE